MSKYDDYVYYKSFNTKNYYNDFIPIKNYGNIYEPKVFTESEKELIEKFILDALVEAGVLKDDNRRIVTNFRDNFEYADQSKVIVELEEI